MLTRSRSARARRPAVVEHATAESNLLHEGRGLLRLAGPLVVSQLGGVGMNTMDTIMVGPLGADALAAVGLAVSIHLFALVVAMGVLIGMSPLVSQAYGAGDREQCRRVLVQGLWLSAALSLPVMALNWFGESIALGLGQQPHLAAVAGDYLRALTPGVLPFLLFMAYRQFLEGMSIARPAMLVTFLGLGVNYFGNRALIYGVDGWIPAMGVVGSGWATTLVQIAMLAAILLYLRANPDLHPLRGIRRLPNLPLLKRVVALGLPTALQLGTEIGFFSACAVMMGWLGALELGTHQITINIASTTFMVALGVSLAGSIRVGHAIGAGDAQRARQATLATYSVVLLTMAGSAVLFLAGPAFLLSLYTTDDAIVRLGIMLLGFAAAFQLFDGAQVAGACVLRGAADTRVPMVITTFAYLVVGIPVAYGLAFRAQLGAAGVWAGMIVALGVAAVLLAWRVRRVVWRGGASRRPRPETFALPAS